MTYPIRFTEEAEKDLTEAASWFADEIGIELANRFIDSVEATTQKIAENPVQFAVVYKTYRQCVIRTFSYVVTYRINNQSIEILAITHGSRNPGVWKQR
jgi:toxin ParE1/3/4